MPPAEQSFTLNIPDCLYLIDGPYVSEYLKQTIYTGQLAVVRTAAAETFLDVRKTRFVSEAEARERIQNDPETRVHTNSENALEWLYEKCPDWERVQTVKRVKDKFQFRESLKALHPEYQYSGHALEQLQLLDPQQLNFPLILKPAVGFFSLGVQRIEDQLAWQTALSQLEQSLAATENLYPQGVLDNSRFVLEQVILGDEFAVDCYYDAQGEPVILNLMQHLFASDAHMNDRIYFTSGVLVQTYLAQLKTYLTRLGAVFGFANFPAHIEVRISGEEIQAIEVNPLRFGGWCSTADMAAYAWGMNLYAAVQQQLRPDWEALAAKHLEHIYALVVLDNSTGIPGARIKNFNYDLLLKGLSEPLELRKTDHSKFPLFGFVMCRVPIGGLQELDSLLHSDLREFVKL